MCGTAETQLRGALACLRRGAQNNKARSVGVRTQGAGVVNLEKLANDAKVARLLAEATAAVTVDNGTCNLDSTVLRLEKGQRCKPVIEALQAGGLSGYETQWLGRGIMISPPGDGNANRRHASNEAIYESLKRAGWRVTPYYQMD